ncbi:peptidoglycan-binding domain-containing protein [Demequina sp.]|uniref:peptidoglycan-binding domain-containing protein n=1 Tax=Demequina sp. TaxID=2050685 RepID=UPI003D0E3B89
MPAHRFRRAAVGVLVAIGIVAPAVVAVLVANYASSEILTGQVDDRTLTMGVETQQVEISSPVSVTVASTEQIAPAPLLTGGVVTAVLVKPGDAVLSGDKVFAIDGVVRFAYIPSSGAVLYRILCNGDQGPDVSVLQTLLRERGLSGVEVDGKFGPRTERAVVNLNRALGSKDPSRCFDPTVAVPIPSQGATVDAVLVRPGTVASTAAEWAVWVPEVESVNVEPTRTVSLPDGRYSLAVNGTDYGATVMAGEILVDEPQAFAGIVDEAGAAITGNIMLASPVSAQVFPASAIVVARDGSLCVAITQDGGATIDFVTVEPLPVGFGENVAASPRPELEGRDVVLGIGGLKGETSCH